MRPSITTVSKFAARRWGWACALCCLLMLQTKSLRLLNAQPLKDDFPVAGLIGERYGQLDGKEGPLGKPTSEEMDHPEGKGRYQTFEHGAIGWSPATGEKSVQVLYLKDRELVFEWGDTAPFNYDFFLVRWDLNGRNLGQQEVAGGSSGRWVSPVVPGGKYRLVVEGGHKPLVGKADFPQGWSNALYVDYSPPPPEYAPYRPKVRLKPPESRQFDPKLTPTGLYLEEWIRLGGPNGPMGVPTSELQPHPGGGKGGFVQFQNGQISCSPDVWENGVLAAYQEGHEIVVDWTVSWGEPNPPSPYNYDRFILRWDLNGKNVGQIDINADGSNDDANDTHLRTRGMYFLKNEVKDGKNVTRLPDDGYYAIRIEGAEVPTVGGVDAPQGWMQPVTVHFIAPTDTNPEPVARLQYTTNVDLRDLVPADSVETTRDVLPAASVEDAKANFDRRTAAAIRHNASRPLPHTIYRNEENYGEIALAKLAYPDYFASESLPGIDRPVRQEVFESLLRQVVGSKSGTSTDSVPKRTGEYDVALTMLISIVYRYYHVLPADVQNQIIHGLLNKHGPFDPMDTLPFFPAPIPETENHLLMIQSARYLTNQLLHLRDPNPDYDNTRNGMDEWMLVEFSRILTSDFIEYNSRPYQRYTMNPLLNMYSFTSDKKPSSARVKLAARMVLDYVMAKVAVSSNDSRRSAPFRRKKTHTEPHFLYPSCDQHNAYSMAFAGTTDIASKYGWLPSSYAGKIQWAGLSDYRVPDEILDLMIERSHRLFFQRFHHDADEAYASSPSYLISAGGRHAPPAYEVAGIFSKEDDLGLALPTTFMPTGQWTSRDDLIRFDGAQEDDQRFNMGVAPDFGCGLNPVIPERYRLAAVAVDRDGRRTPDNLKIGPWTFIDQSAPKRERLREFYRQQAIQEGKQGYHIDVHVDQNDGGYVKGPIRHGYYLAVYRGDGFGFLEAYDLVRSPSPLTFQEFMDGVLKRNGGTVFTIFGQSSYAMTDGRTIKFELTPHSLVVGRAEEPFFLSGTILNSEQGSGYITIANPALKRRIVLDMRNFEAPKREVLGTSAQ